ncbi:tetratricopeptide repeat protein [Rubrivivax rivuli]|uniref:Uncharacterized protein n=1 Tax=Rubrivivax rivuli TaxID=1862385 RepID=A0A437RLY1_9BURK|nr:hypothetical protein [Rubrivivax rivuli]RVU47779.1 hypothetical protein EOE66_08630 [Rubrivivax rivuli]
MEIVERFHFTPRVEALIGGSSGYLGGDLSYTLNASPNHHRALVAAMNFAARTKSPTPPHMTLSVECYFDRATRFKPSDTIVRRLYAIYLSRLKRVPEAQRQLEVAEHFAKQAQDGMSLHNLGLVYLEVGLPEQALRVAHEAATMGFEGTQLREALQKAGHWKDPTQ